MKITNKQLQQLIIVLSESLRANNSSTIFYTYSSNDRKDLLDEILNQQDDSPEVLKNNRYQQISREDEKSE